MNSLSDRDASLRLCYDQVINTHKKLAAVLSNVAGIVVDGRIPSHDLPTMLRGLAEREGIMAENWTLVRDGLLNKMIDNTILGVPAVSAAVYAVEHEDENQFQVQMNKKRRLNCPERQGGIGQPELLNSGIATSVEKAKRQAGLERRTQKDAQLEAQPQANQAAKRLTKAERQRRHCELLRVHQERKQARLAKATSARQKKQQKEERLAREAKARLAKQQRKAEKRAQHVKKLLEKKDRKPKLKAEREAKDVAGIVDQNASSFPPPQRSLPTLAYDTDGLTIKEEIIEPWEI